jgi:DNA mismatch endonuclease Vsr
MDRISKEARSRIMASIRARNTTPELAVRRLLHSLGLRYRLHERRLPGSPDVVFKSRKVAVFVHGCFWHSHPGCKHNRLTSTQSEYWKAKLTRNVERDARKERELARLGWRVLVIWECEAKRPELILTKLSGFLGPSYRQPSRFSKGTHPQHAL